MLKNLLVIFNLALISVFANWSKNKVIIIIIIVSIMLIQILLSISIGFKGQVKNFALDSLVGNLKIMNPNYKVDNSIKNNFEISDDIIDKIKKINGVKGVTKRIQVPIVIKSEREIRNAILVGIDTNTEKDLSFIGKSYDYNKFKDAFKDSGVLMGQELLNKIRTQKSFKVVASGQNAKDKRVEESYFIKDTYLSSLPYVEGIYIFTDIKQIEKSFSLKNAITELSIVLFDDDNLEDVYLQVSKIMPKNLKLYTWGDINPFLKGWLDMMYVNLLVFFGVVFFAATIPLTNTILISVLERINEFGIMQALGFRKVHLFFFIMFEAIIILVIGILAGIAMGLLISYILQLIGIPITPFAKGAANLGLGNYIYPKIDIKNSIKIGTVMLVLGVIASLYPSFRAIFYNPMQALSKRRS